MTKYIELTLINFGCWIDNTFKLPLNKLTLLSAPSGKGKTTILKAINYAITGKDKYCNYNSKKCTVIFKGFDMVIKRTNTPIRILVTHDDITIEQDEAQSYINNKFSPYFSFGYIQQKSENSFLSLTPGEKLLFLEKIAFPNGNINTLKDNLKNLISSKEKEFLRTQGEFDGLSKNKPQVPQKHPFTKDDLENMYKDIIQKISREENILLETLQIEKENALKLQKKDNLLKMINSLSFPLIEPLKELIKVIDITSLEENYNTYFQEYKDLKEKEKIRLINDKEREEIKIKLSLLSLHEIPEQKDTSSLEKSLQNILDFEEYSKNLKVLKELEDRFATYVILPESEEKIFDTKELIYYQSMLKDYNKQEEIKLEKEKYVYDDVEITKLKNDIQILEDELSYYILGKEARMCPKCQSSLRVCKDNLTLYTGSKYCIETEKEYKTKISSLKSLLSTQEYSKKRYQSLPVLEDEIIFETPSGKTDIEDIIKELLSEQKEILEYSKQRDKVISQNKLTKSSKDYLTLPDKIQKLENSLSFLGGQDPFKDLPLILKPEENKKDVQSQLNEANFFNKNIDRLQKENIKISNDISKHQDKLSMYSEAKNQAEKLIEIEKIYFETQTILEKTRKEISQIKDENNKKTKHNDNQSRNKKIFDESLQKKDELNKELQDIILIDTKDVSDIKLQIISIKEEEKEILLKKEKRREFDETVKVYNEWVRKYKVCKEELATREKDYTNIKKFKEYVSTAEMLAIENVIDELNSYLQNYLDMFFPDNPLTIEIKMFKENEKKNTIKSQVNLSVGYHGVETDLHSLSGGEKDRVNLAFTLCLADIFDLKILMLDEVLSALDTSSVDNILDHIQKNRTIFLVAHQAVTGVFDEVINI